MSNNFELMQEMLRETEIDRETSPASQSGPILFPASVESTARRPAAFDGVAQEECLKLVQRIFLRQPSQVIVFAGIDNGDGCSRICAETALILAANTPASVCVVDADFRAPSLPDFFGVTNHLGLSNSLIEAGAIRTFTKQLKSPNLFLLSAGDQTRGLSPQLSSDSFKIRFKELREEFRYILIDAPALNLYADAVALARHADGLVVVLQAESTRRESAGKALEMLREANVHVLGAVLNRRTFPIPNFLYRRL